MKRFFFVLLLATFAFGVVIAQEKTTTKETPKSEATETVKGKMECCSEGKGCCKEMKGKKARATTKDVQKKVEKSAETK